MKYMQDGGFQKNPLMRLTLSLTLGLLVLFWGTNLAMYGSRMGLAPASVVTYYNGSEADFRPPRSAASMLEVTHMHLPMMGVVLLLLTHLAVFLPWSRGAKRALVWTAFASALMEEGGGWLVRFVSPDLAFVKIAGFVVLQSTLALVLGALALFLFRAGQRAEAPEPVKARRSVALPVAEA